MRNDSDKSYRENEITHLKSNNIFRKLRRLWDNVDKYCKDGEATDDSKESTHCMLYT